jgi:predicted RNase H-like HicB family nuclease
MHVHQEVLAAANRIGSQRGDWTFSPLEIVQALPVLKESSVRTHIVSRCCVNAPKNHLHRWDYFRRIARGQYEVRPKYRSSSAPESVQAQPREAGSDSHLRDPGARNVIHAVIHKDENLYTAECLEVAVVTQGETLDEVFTNLNEAIGLHLEGENLAIFGLSDHPRLQVLVDTPLSL